MDKIIIYKDTVVVDDGDDFNLKYNVNDDSLTITDVLTSVNFVMTLDYTNDFISQLKKFVNEVKKDLNKK